MIEDEKREQVAQQCKAVAHLATALADVHRDYERMFHDGRNSISALTDQVGARTASFIEQLGNMLNAIDACEEEDVWMEPVFEVDDLAKIGQLFLRTTGRKIAINLIAEAGKVNI